MEEQTFDLKAHWDGVYTRMAADAVSWYRPHLETSLRWIDAMADRKAPIIDVGGGHSRLVDDLIRLGYQDVTVLDVSETALQRAKERLGDEAKRVQWQAGNLLTAELPQSRYEVWHDRAVFHFLTNPEDRAAYVHQAERTIRPQGHLILATFGPEGPQKCSGLETCRYGPESLSAVLGPRFQLLDSLIEVHTTPSGKDQQFLYCHFRFV
jgi:2-polyprenyl-3-methyl-5-hydroxy-6-metoxy-1,4-benzoquinol methylase